MILYRQCNDQLICWKQTALAPPAPATAHAGTAPPPDTVPEGGKASARVMLATRTFLAHHKEGDSLYQERPFLGVAHDYQSA